MKVPIERVIAICEFSGGAVAPPLVLALCSMLRQCQSLVVDMALCIDSGKITNEQLDDFTARMERARTAELPCRPF